MSFQIRDVCAQDRSRYVEMSQQFYNSDATLHPVPVEHFEQTFSLALSGNPYLRLLMIEYEQDVAGYALLAFTYSNEAGGMVVWLEELFILPAYRNLSLGAHFLQWVKQTYQQKAKRYRLELCSQNTGARRLYVRHDFTPLPYEQMTFDL